jgi:hypothetical protein
VDRHHGALAKTKLSEHSAGARTKIKPRTFQNSSCRRQQRIKQSPVRTEGDYKTESRELAAEMNPRKNLVLEKSEKDSLSADQTQRETNPTEITAAAASEQP